MILSACPKCHQTLAAPAWTWCLRPQLGQGSIFWQPWTVRDSNGTNLTWFFAQSSTRDPYFGNPGLWETETERAWPCGTSPGNPDSERPEQGDKELILPPPAGNPDFEVTFFTSTGDPILESISLRPVRGLGFDCSRHGAGGIALRQVSQQPLHIHVPDVRPISLSPPANLQAVIVGIRRSFSHTGGWLSGLEKSTLVESFLSGFLSPTINENRAMSIITAGKLWIGLWSNGAIASSWPSTLWTARTRVKSLLCGPPEVRPHREWTLCTSRRFSQRCFLGKTKKKHPTSSNKTMRIIWEAEQR